MFNHSSNPTFKKEEEEKQEKSLIGRKKYRDNCKFRTEKEEMRNFLQKKSTINISIDNARLKQSENKTEKGKKKKEDNRNENCPVLYTMIKEIIFPVEKGNFLYNFSPVKIDIYSQTTYPVFKNFSFNLIDLIFSYSTYDEVKTLFYTIGNRKISRILLKDYQKRIKNVFLKNEKEINLLNTRLNYNSKTFFSNLKYLTKYHGQDKNLLFLPTLVSTTTSNLKLSYRVILSLKVNQYNNYMIGINRGLSACLDILSSDFNLLHKISLSNSGNINTIRYFEKFSQKILFIILMDKFLIYELNFKNLKKSKILHTFKYTIEELIFYESPGIGVFFFNDEMDNIISLKFFKEFGKKPDVTNLPIFTGIYLNERMYIQNRSVKLIDVQKFSVNHIVSYFIHTNLNSNPVNPNQLSMDDSLENAGDNDNLSLNKSTLSCQENECYSKIYLTELTNYTNKILEGPNEKIMKVFFSPGYSRDKDVLISFYEMTQIRVWKMKTLECIKIIEYDSGFASKFNLNCYLNFDNFNVFSLFQIRSDAFCIRRNIFSSSKTSVIFLKDISNLTDINEYVQEEEKGDKITYSKNKLSQKKNKINKSGNQSVFHIPSSELNTNSFKAYLYSTCNPGKITESTFKFI